MTRRAAALTFAMAMLKRRAYDGDMPQCVSREMRFRWRPDYRLLSPLSFRVISYFDCRSRVNFIGAESLGSSGALIAAATSIRPGRLLLSLDDGQGAPPHGPRYAQTTLIDVKHVNT